MLMLNSRLSFGKFKGQLVSNVLIHSPEYIRWLKSKGIDIHEQVIKRLGNN